MNKVKILYIDDEVHNLNAFRSIFRRDYEVFTASEVQKARKLLVEHEIPIIIADQKMPGTTGIEFFTSIKKTHPDSIRILITAYTETESLIDSINKGQIYRYIKKPWDYYELKNTITNAYEIYSTRKLLDQKIRGFKKGRKELKAFIRQVSTEVQGLLSSSQGILNLMEADQSDPHTIQHITLVQKNLDSINAFSQRMTEYFKNSNLFIKEEEINFKELVRGYKEKYEAAHNDFSLKTNIQQRHPFRGDLFRIETIFDNLISNAIRFSDNNHSPSTLSITVLSDKREAKFIFEDNGIGIQEKELPQIFNLFFHSEEHNDAGHGIGLYIVKETLNRMDGQITVASSYGEGTTFTIQLPNYR